MYIATIHDPFADFGYLSCRTEILVWVRDCALATLKRCEGCEGALFNHNVSPPEQFSKRTIKFSKEELIQRFRTELCKKKELLDHDRKGKSAINWLGIMMTPGLDPVNMVASELLANTNDIDVFCGTEGSDVVVNWVEH
jgi:hypothetical protein